MNDPNGLWFEGGRLHVTYQHNPAEPRWGGIHWGHAVTDDLVTWQHRPIAIAPDPDGPDASGCWSGCVVDTSDGPVILYSGVRLDGTVRRQVVCRANPAPDGDGWRKDPANPLIATPPPGIDPELFRDPFAWHDGDAWQMLIGAGTTEGRGCAVLYTSPDLARWELVGQVLSAGDVDPIFGSEGPMWECPQLLRFPAGDVLIVSVVDPSPGIRPSHVTAFSGRFDGRRFHAEHAQQLGMGPDFYAPAATRMADGRHLLFGWVPEDPPGPDSDRTWAGALTLPYTVTLGDDGRVGLAFAREVQALHGPTRAAIDRLLIAGAPPVPEPLPGGPLELDLEVQPGEATEIILELHDGDDTEPAVRVAYLPADRALHVARRGIVSVAGRSSAASAMLPSAPDGDARSAGGRAVPLRMILDGSIVELEVAGQVMATLRRTVHPGPQTLTAQAVGGQGARIRLEVVELRAPGVA